MALCLKDPLNGLILNGYCLPKEIVGHLLTFLDYKTLLLSGRRVCHQWKLLIEDCFFWKRKAKLEGCFWPEDFCDHDLPWMYFARYCLKNPFNRNFVRNPHGVDKLVGWKVLRNGGDGFTTENPPLGCDDVPGEAGRDAATENTCFATSYHPCCKEQIIRIFQEGFCQQTLDTWKPAITFSDWYTGPIDNSFEYDCLFSLLDDEEEVLDEYSYSRSHNEGDGLTWKKVEHTFRNYPDGLVYARIRHSGRTYWNGNENSQGTKMTAASVRFSWRK